MSESQEKLGKIEEMRDKSNSIHEAHGTIADLLGELTGHTQRLGDEWDDPAAGEIQAIVAGVMRQVQDVNELIGGFAQRLRMGADQAEQSVREETAREQEAREQTGEQGEPE